MERRPRRYVTLEGYAVEGGFDGPYQPATCYVPTIALGRHVGPGDADDLWHDYERVLDLVPALGFDGVRLNVEWARVEPRRGEVDDAALERYAEVARYATSLGLGVTVGDRRRGVARVARTRGVALAVGRAARAGTRAARRGDA